MTAARKLKAAPSPKRVAVYTRKSTDKALDAAFTSLDNQRESILAYVASQAHAGWTAIDERYDDGGFSGGTTERPAFQRLLVDVRAGKIDVLAVYKIDRISRSLADFTGIVAELERHGVALISVTESFDTSTPMGRWTLNLLASFAQFERELIAERTRDKMRATRRRGLWCGGSAPFGYRIVDKQLVPDPDEADRLRALFDEYLRLGSIQAVADTLNARGWRTRQGRRWQKSNVAALLRNPTPTGQLKAGDEVVDGQHEALLASGVYERVQAQLITSGRRGGARAKNKHYVLLRGLLTCGSCGAAMKHTFTSKAHRRFHYYKCSSRRNDGTRCSGSSVSLPEIESFVVGKVGEMGRDADMIERVVAAAKEEAEREHPKLHDELQRLRRDRTTLARKRQRLVDAIAEAGQAEPAIRDAIGNIEAEIQELTDRETELEGTLAGLDREALDAEEAAEALRSFDTIWAHLDQPERERLLRLVLCEVRWHGATGEVELIYRDGFEG